MSGDAIYQWLTRYWRQDVPHMKQLCSFSERGFRVRWAPQAGLKQSGVCQ